MSTIFQQSHKTSTGGGSFGKFLAVLLVVGFVLVLISTIPLLSDLLSKGGSTASIFAVNTASFEVLDWQTLSLFSSGQDFGTEVTGKYNNVLPGLGRCDKIKELKGLPCSWRVFRNNSVTRVQLWVGDKLGADAAVVVKKTLDFKETAFLFNQGKQIFILPSVKVVEILQSKGLGKLTFDALNLVSRATYSADKAYLFVDRSKCCWGPSMARHFESLGYTVNRINETMFYYLIP